MIHDVTHRGNVAGTVMQDYHDKHSLSTLFNLRDFWVFSGMKTVKTPEE